MDAGLIFGIVYAAGALITMIVYDVREYNNRNVDRFNPGVQGNNYFNPYKQNYLNGQTYRQNNGEYSCKYY